MTYQDSFDNKRDLLLRIGYPETRIENIDDELNKLFSEINFEIIRKSAHVALNAKDTEGFIKSLKDLMISLENKGYYRPDFPTSLIKHIVNGLNLKNEDIFLVLDRAMIPDTERLQQQEFLASCAAITQLGYILLSCLVPEVKAASSEEHVFLIIDNLSPSKMIFVDISIDSIKELDIREYELKNNYYILKKNLSSDEQTSLLLKTYYSFFNVTSGFGLSHNIHNNLGITYDMIGRYDEAVQEMNEALRLDPGYIEVHNNLAVTFNKLGELESAENELKEALRLNPEYPEAHCNLGVVYMGAGKYEEAEVELKEAIRLRPENFVAHHNLGNLYALEKKYDEAISEFNKALQLNPDNALTHNDLGNIFLESGKNEEALKCFQEAVRIDAEFAEAHLGIGMAHYNMGSYDRAAQSLSRGVYLDKELMEFVPDKLGIKVRQGILRLERAF